MAIRDIFKMIKADRYTQDGREELIKAQEAVTEDVTYKPGDISRKTGLQKQPDGSWAPVKNAPAQSKKMDKAKQSEIAKRGEIVTKMSDLVAQKSRPESAPTGRQPTPEMLEREKMRLSPEAKARRDKLDAEHPRTETGAPMKGIDSAGIKKMESLGFKQDGNSWVAESNGNKFEIKINHQPETEYTNASTRAELFINGKKRPYEFGGGDSLDPNSMVKIEKALKEQGYKKQTESPSASGSTSKDVKSMSISELKEQRDKLKSGSGPENDAQYKKVNDELTRKRLQTLSVGSEVKAHGTPLKITSINPDTNTIKGEFDHKGEKLSTTIGLEDIDDYDNITESGGSAPSDLKIQGMSKEEYIPWRMKTYKENEAQASSVWNHFAEQQKNKGKENEYDPDFHPLRDSAPRILTGDCKVRIKKSK